MLAGATLCAYMTIVSFLRFAFHSSDKVKEWKKRLKNRSTSGKYNKPPIGFSNQSTIVSAHLINSL